MAIDVQNLPGSSVPTLASGISAASVEGPPERSTTTLVSGIIADAQHLIEQQLAMFRQELRNDLRKSKEAALSLAVGGGITLVGGVLLLLMLPLLLHWAVPEFPLWACCGAPGAILVVLGAALFRAGVRKLESFSPLSDQSAEAFKETMKWKTNLK